MAFADIVDINPKSSKLPPKFYYIDLESVKGGRLLDDKIVEANNAPSRAQRQLVPNDIIFQTVRPYQQNNYYYAEERDLPSIASTGYAVLRTKQDPKFIYSLIHTQRFLTPVLQRCTGSSYPAVTGTDLEDIPTWIPCVEEQKRIGELLDLIDKKIDLQTKIIENLKKYKRGVIYELFVNPNSKFCCEMSFIPMTDLLTEYRNRNTEGLRVCSVAVNKGVVDQIEHLGRSFAASDTSHYGRVQFGDVVYTKSPTGDFPFGIVKQSKLNEEVAVSPLYGVYTPASYATGNLIHSYFEQYQYANNYICTLAQKGAKNTINITNQRFLEKGIRFPIEERDREYFSDMFDMLTEKAYRAEKMLELLMAQKRTLLAKMFI